ncbi:hypothetical protein RSAG8_02820, partial [Rhizoctonia solani AG-8 WAC10335]
MPSKSTSTEQKRPRGANSVQIKKYSSRCPKVKKKHVILATVSAKPDLLEHAK